MRHLIQVASLIIATASLSCAPAIKLARPPAEEVIIEPGKLTIDGKAYDKTYDTWYTFADGKLTPHQSGFKLEPIVGADLVGLTGSPWAGIRYVHIENVGLDLGFDRANFTLGFDYLYHTIVIGPNICFPYDLGDSHFGFKAGFLF